LTKTKYTLSENFTEPKQNWGGGEICGVALFLGYMAAYFWEVYPSGTLFD